MLFTEQDLYVNNGLNILDEATYLSEDESLINPTTIPVKEVSRLGYGVVRFDDVEKLSEDYGIDYIDAMYAIAESSDMNPEYLAVSVPEEDIIAYPEIVNELANIVVQPLSESDYEYQYVTECVDAWLESGDEEYLAAIEIFLEWSPFDQNQKGDNENNNELKSVSDLDRENVQSRIAAGAKGSNPLGLDSVAKDKRKNRIYDRHAAKKANDSNRLQLLRMSSLIDKYGLNKAMEIRRRLNDRAKDPAARANRKIRRELAKTKRQLGTSQYRVDSLRQTLNDFNNDLIRSRGELTDERSAHGKTRKALGKSQQDTTSLIAGLNQATKEGMAEKNRADIMTQQRDAYMNAFQKADSDLTAERSAHGKTREDLGKTREDLGKTREALGKSQQDYEAYRNKGLHRAADKLYSAGNWMKNNKGKTALGVGLGAAAIGGGIYAYKQYKNRPRSVIAKRIAALRGIYKKFMVNAQRNPQKANIFKRMAAKILSVIDKLMAYMQNAAG